MKKRIRKPKFGRFFMRILLAAALVGITLEAAKDRPDFSAWLSGSLCTSVDLDALFSFLK